jgi:hypothetical protein
VVFGIVVVVVELVVFIEVVVRMDVVRVGGIEVI